MAIRILGGTKETLTLELEVSGDAQKAVLKLLLLLSKLGGWGSSRSVGVIDDNEGLEDDTVYFDGDGADKVHIVSVNGQPYTYS
jgi:hypothetical protein